MGDGGSGPCPQNGEQFELSFTGRLSMLDRSHSCAIRAAKRVSSVSCAERASTIGHDVSAPCSATSGVPSPPLPVSAEPGRKGSLRRCADALPHGAPMRPPSPLCNRGRRDGRMNGLLVQGRRKKGCLRKRGGIPLSRPGTAIAPDEFGERCPRGGPRRLLTRASRHTTLLQEN